MVEKVNHHASVSIIQGKGSLDFMFQEYDDTYPREAFRKQIHIIGGNYQKGDKSPECLLNREIREEFSPQEEDPSKGIESHLVSVIGSGPGAQRVGDFAPIEDILRIRDNILGTVSPYADFLYHVPEMGGKAPFNGIVSVYSSFVEPELLDKVRKYIAEGKAVRNEGLTKIVPADRIFDGTVPAAWWTRDIMGQFLGNPSTNIHGIKVEQIGVPQGSWKTYLERFEYKVAMVDG